MSEENFKEKRIALVAPRTELVAGAVAALERAGATVEWAREASSAPSLLMCHDVDLLIVDVEIIQNNGLAFVKEATKLWPWLPIIVAGKKLAAQQKRALVKLGVEHFVENPRDYCDYVAGAASELVQATPWLEDKENYRPIDFQYQLRILRLVTEPAMQAGTLEEALGKLAEGLGRLVSASLVAILGMEEKRGVVVVRTYEHVAPELVGDAKTIIRRRYEQLVGEELSAPLACLQEGLEPDGSGARTIGSSFSVPIVGGGRVDGVLLVASSENKSYSDQMISFIYHAANHFSTVFAALSQIRKQATRDPLTGLLNRFHIEQEYLAIATLCERYHHSMGVVIVDIDHFKAVNDTYGHLVGDEVLREFSQILREVTRASDVTGRYGGEEFVIVLPRGDRCDALSYAERLREIVGRHVFCRGTYDLRLTISVGVAFGNPLTEDKGKDFPLLVKADTAVYEAKKCGRNRIQIWSEELVPKLDRAVPAGGQFQALAEKRKEGRILVVDDEESVRRVVRKALELEGYETAGAGDGQEALDIIVNAPYAYDLVVTDLKMAGMDGAELIRRIRGVNDAILSIAISGRATVESAVDCLRQGAYDFIEKPLLVQHLQATVKRALNYRSVMLENRRYQEHLSEMVQQKSAKLNETLEEVRKSYDFTLESLVSLLDAREKDFGQHSKRVRDMGCLLARQMNLPAADVEIVAQGALLHDIGKIGVPDRILLKRGTLTKKEWEIMRQHAEIGYRILAPSPYLKEVSEIVHSHHERYDGEGYPRGIKGRDISLGARIFAVVDAYDAIRSTRTYRTARPAATGLAEIERGSGTQFDPEVVAAFRVCHPEIEQLFMELQ